MDHIRPDHYHAGGIDPFTFFEANMTKQQLVGYHKGSAIKYIVRAGKKTDYKSDFEKAGVHLEKLIELMAND